MCNIIVVSTTSDSDSYSSRLAQHFIRGAKDAGMEVEIISLGGKTIEEAYEIGKRSSVPANKETPSITQPTIRADVRVQKMVLVIGRKILPRRQIVADLGLQQRSRPCFINNYLKPTFSQGYIEFAYPNSPHKPEQAYKLTAKGLNLYKQLTQETNQISQTPTLIA